MRASVRVAPTPGAGVAITIDDPAKFHQTGTVNMVARPILPYGGFPAPWNAAIKQAASEQFREATSGID